MMALIYIFHEFGDVNLKVTTVLDEKGVWLGKVILEGTTQTAKDNEEFIDFYTSAIAEQERHLGE